MIEPGSVKVGDKVKCPEGAGKVEKIYDPDNILIKLDDEGINGKDIFSAYDLSECSWEDGK